MACLSSLGAYLLILLACWVSISSTSPTPQIADSHRFISVSPRHHPKVQHLPLQPGPSLLRKKAVNVPRADWIVDYMDEGWALYFSVYKHYLSTENAALALQTFYTKIGEYVQDDLAQTEPLKAFAIDVGQLSLEFVCEAIAIPWGFVAMFVDRMANSAATGFAGLFEAMLQHLMSGGIIYVRLKVRPDVAPAARRA